MRRTTWALAVLMLGLLASGCGKSKQHEILDQLQAECEALVTSHASFRDAEIDFRAAYPIVGPACAPDLLPLSANDTCAAASATTQVCRVQYAYNANDLSLCSAGRCYYVCEVRLMQADLQAAVAAGDLTLAPICASRWIANAF